MSPRTSGRVERVRSGSFNLSEDVIHPRCTTGMCTVSERDVELTGDERIQVGVRPARQIGDLGDEGFTNTSDDASNNCDCTESRVLAEGRRSEREVDVNCVGSEGGDVSDEGASIGGSV